MTIEILRLLRIRQGGRPDAIGPGVIDEALRAASVATETNLLARLATSAGGLSDEEAAARLEEQGPNQVAQERPPTWYQQIYHAFRNPFVLLLMVLAGVSLATDDVPATIIISVMVLVSVLLRFVQERRSVVAVERLKAMVKVTGTAVRRDAAGTSRPIEVALEELVGGDIVRLSAGDMVPADVRLLAAKDLFISQATLTGEALPVEKFAGAAPNGPVAPLESANLCFLGTNVVSGSATAVAVSTGARTYLGSLARSVVGVRSRTAFDAGVHRVSMLFVRLSAAMAVCVFFINGLGKHDWTQAFLFAVSVAVGLTPEMLPLVVSTTLALGSVQMSKKKVIIKRQSAIQNIGAMDILCTDKTGTLTRDQVVLIRCCDVTDREDEEVFRYAYLNSNHQTGLKNLLDRAILDHREIDISAIRKIDEIPFDFSRRLMSVVVESDGKRQLIAKGAPAEILGRCDRFELQGKVLDIEHLVRGELRHTIDRLSAEGFRVLAVAYKDVEEEPSYSKQDECGLVLRGYVAFLDPPKESTPEAIAALRAYGVGVKVLTGDNEIVTRKICGEVGLTVDRVILGADLQKIDDQTLGALAENTTVFARLTPAQKERVIEALRARGHVVGFLGDGMNDAPALRAADVGISVNNAVDIAKDSADVILLEKSLLVLEDGVLEGRRVFGNILKYIRMGLSSNFGNMFSVLGASLLLPFLPMLPLQLLIQNLLYDLSQTAIPFDSVDEEYLHTPRRWEINNLFRFTLFFGPVSSIFDYTTFALLFFIFGANTLDRQHLFQSGWFVEGLLSQTLIVHMIRTRKVPFFQSRAAYPLALATIAVMVVGVWLPFSALAPLLDLTPLPAAYFPWLAATLAAYFLLTQGLKTLYDRRYGYNESARLLGKAILLIFALVLTGPVLAAPMADEIPGGSTDIASPQSDAAAPSWSVHGQITYQLQGHGEFHAPYEGQNSFLNRDETRGSFTSTLFFGYRAWHGGEVYVNPELIAGQGLSAVLGLASPPNGETYRVDSTQAKLTLGRLFLRQTWSLDQGSEPVDDGPNQLAGRRTGSRVVLTVGKFSATDVFDANLYAHDPRSQFDSWSLWANGAWDYPADTRGYTWGFAVEYFRKDVAIRLGSFMEPLEANGLAFDHDVLHAHGDALEFEHDHHLGGRPGAIRFVVFANHARMGVYEDALALAPSAPDVTATREPGRLKYGYGLNVEQALTPNSGIFFRAGWNDGRTESWAFTEIERTVALGYSLGGKPWGRPADHLGAAVAVNGISPDHRDYLAAGGYGFMLGDGRLSYDPEQVFEAYYSVALCKIGSFSLEVERFTNPAFNEDRGPVTVLGSRLHLEF
jgi:Mg2+-importing ATPase